MHINTFQAHPRFVIIEMRSACFKVSAQGTIHQLAQSIHNRSVRRCTASTATVTTTDVELREIIKRVPGHPVIYHPDFTINPIQDGHRFPMPKDHLLHVKLKEIGLAGNTFTPSYPSQDTVQLAHDEAYVRSFMDGSISKDAMRKIGLPWSAQLVQRTLIGVGSAILAGRLALQYGVACMCNGGTHHAHRSHGSGWCIFNDQAVAARAAQRDAGVGKVLFIDLDVHQGDGTATIFADDPTVFTLSVHCAGQGFPHQPATSDMDIALPPGTTDDEYMQVLENLLPRVIAEQKPDLIMYNAGVDIHKEDMLGKFALTNDGIARRDMLVMSLCAQSNIPVAASIGGGYQQDHHHIVDRHVSLHRAAAHWLPVFLEGRHRKLVEKREARHRSLS